MEDNELDNEAGTSQHNTDWRLEIWFPLKTTGGFLTEEGRENGLGWAGGGL